MIIGIHTHTDTANSNPNSYLTSRQASTTSDAYALHNSSTTIPARTPMMLRRDSLSPCVACVQPWRYTRGSFSPSRSARGKSLYVRDTRTLDVPPSFAWCECGVSGVGGVEEEERVDTAFEAGVAVRNEARLEGHL